MMNEMWTPGNRVLTGDRIAIDTETELIKDHLPPPLVLMQVYTGGDKVHLVGWQDAQLYLDKLSEECPRSRIVFHNCAFDIPVLGYHQWLLDAVGDERLGDTMLRYALWKLYTEGDYLSLSLEHAVKDLFHFKMDKSDDVRLTFSRDMPELDAAHRNYAASDVDLTWRLDERILKDGTVTEGLQVKAAIALGDISKLGFAVDKTRRSKLESQFQRRLDDTKEVLDANGYVPGKPGNKAVLQKILGDIEREFKIPFPRTSKRKEISVSKEAMDAMPEAHPFLTALKNHDHYGKIITTYLRGDVGSDGRVHTRFKTIMKTGRTSSCSPNLFVGNKLQFVAA